MADSDAVRSRRKRLHARGDHSECGRGCADRRGRPVIVGVVPAEGSPSPASDGFDPRAALEGLARRLEAAHEKDPADAALARVLKDTLLALGAAGGDDDEAAAFLREFRSA